MKKFVYIFMAVAVCVAVAACDSSDGDGDSKSTPVPIESLSLDPKTMTLEIGEKKGLVHKILPSNADDRSVTWSSDDQSVATVSAAGEVEGRKAGTAKITVTSSADNMLSASCVVTVNPKAPVVVVYQMPKTVTVNGVTFTYTMTGDKISKVVASAETATPAETVTSVTYDLVFEGNTCIINFSDDNNGVCRYIFTLNSDGKAEQATSFYVNEDGSTSAYETLQFTYVDKMLTKMDDGNDPVLFKGVYDSGVLKSFTASALGESGSIAVTSSEHINNCAIDPIFMLPTFVLSAEVRLTAAAAAVFLNLLPHSMYLPASIAIPEGTFPVVSQITDNKVMSYTIGVDEMTLQTVVYTY